MPAFDERRRTGILRYVVLRSNASGQVLAALVVARPLPDGPALAAELRAAAPELVGVAQVQNQEAGNVIFPPASAGADEVLAGAGELREELGRRAGGHRPARLPAAEPGGGPAGLRRHP